LWPRSFHERVVVKRMEVIKTAECKRKSGRGWIAGRRSSGLRFTAIIFAAVLTVRQSGAQESAYSLPTEKHSRELALTTGFAVDLPGGSRGGDYWTAQLRMGRTLFAPRALRGALEAAFEVEPAMILRQDGFLYGVGLTPLLLQWNVNTGSRLAPFVNAGAGLLLTSAKFPRDTTHVNFTPQGGVGAYWFSSSTRAWVVGLGFHHTSNSGLASSNPGHNALYLHAGLSWWR
jgi:hypothetical protein